MHQRLLSTALICLLAQSAFARNIFITPNDTSSNQLATVNSEPFAFGTSLSTIPGATAVLPSANAQKYYVVSSSFDSVGVLTGRFPNVAESARIATGTTVSSGQVTPDGRRLILVGANGTVIVDTTTDRAVLSVGGADTGTNPVDVAVSLDSRYAYVLSAASGRVTAIDLNSNTVARTAQVPTSATSIAVAPTGVVYVAGSTQVIELDPLTLAVRANIPVSGSPDAFQFTPGGRYAIARNLSNFAGRGLMILDLQARRVLDTPSLAALSSVAVVSDNLVFGVIPGGNLIEIRIASDGSVSQSTPQITTGTLPLGIFDIEATGELPAAHGLMIVSGNNAYRLDLTTRELAGPVNIGVSQGNISSVLPFGTGSVTGLLSYNTTQTAPAGTTSLPLTVLAYDANGLPVMGANVVFSTPGGVSLSATNATTNMFGLATSSVVIPAGRTGSIPVTAAVGNRSVSFTVNVGDAGLPGSGGGTGTGANKFTIVSGQGGVVKAGFSTSFDGQPLRIRYMDAAGNAIANAPITWTLTEGTGGTLVLTNGGATDGDGFSTANLTTITLPNAAFPYQRFTITTTAPDGQSQTFFVTSLRIANGIGGLQVAGNPPNNSPITAQAGQTLAGALTYSVRSLLDGVPIPSVGLSITSLNQDPALGPVAQCSGGTVFSDAQGNITCDLVITGRPGTTNLTAIVGQTVSFSYPLQVNPGLPAVARILSGNNQVGNPGQQLTPLTVEIADSAGNVLPGVNVQWSYPANASVSNEQKVTDGNGRASTTVTLPNTAGPIVVTVRSNVGTASASFNLTAAVSTGNIQIAGGDAQSATVNQPFGQALQVRVVDTNNNPVSGAPVTFSVVSGSATLSSSSATTNAQGIASTSVSAGATAGPIVIAATSGNFRVQFSLTARAVGPQFTAADILNGASFQPGISPGSIAWIRVRGIAPNVRGSVIPTNLVGPLPNTLADVQVTIGGITAPIFSVSNINGEESVAVQVPYEVPVGRTTVTVQSATGGATTVADVEVKQYSPGVFTWTDPASNSVTTVAVRPDGSYVNAGNPARRGEVIRIFATGLGQTTPVASTNRPGIAGQTVSAPLVVGINNAGTRLVSAELMQGTTGVYVISLEIPADTAAGSNSPVGLGVTFPDGHTEYSNATFIPIQ